MSPLQLVDETFFVEKTFGKYAIKRMIGAGGMGLVFLGIHQTLNKKSAIKVFVPDANDPTFEKRFLREARILGKLHHPNIVEIYDFDISQWNTPYFVMEYLEGRTLAQEIERYESGMPAERVFQLLRQLVPCIAYAHANGVVHRDLKPDNIFLERFKSLELVKVLDFGIAKTDIPGIETSRLTSSQTVLGSPFYLTPEQILKKKIGPHTDQYALALIVYEMLTGEMVRQGKSMGEIMFKVAHHPIRPQRLDYTKVPKAVGHALVKATMPDPDKRYNNMDSFGRAMLGALDSGDISPEIRTELSTIPTEKIVRPRKTISIEEEAQMDLRRRRRLKIILAVLLLVGILAVVYTMVF